MQLVLRRGENPVVVDLIKDKLLHDEDLDTDTYCKMLKDAIIYSPRNIQLLVAFDRDSNELKGYFITIWQPPARYTFISQAWCEPEVSDVIVPRVWAKIQAWTDSLGLRAIRAETWRGAAIIRKYKFVEVTRTVEFVLPGSEPVEEIINGQDEVTTEEHVDAEPRAEGSVEAVVRELLSGEHGSDSDPVRRDTGSGDDPAVRPGDADDTGVPGRAESGSPEGSADSPVGEDSVRAG
jgi:hypothetical protein